MIERIISRGLDAPAKFAPLLEVRKGNHGAVEASKLRKGKSAHNPWTHISHKELYTYCKSLLALSHPYS